LNGKSKGVIIELLHTKTTPLPNNLIPDQTFMKLSNPLFSGSKEFKEWVNLFISIDHLLIDSGLETALKSFMVNEEEIERGRTFDPGEQIKFQRKVSECLRVNIARVLSKKSFKGFSVSLADSHVLQSFCGYHRPWVKKIPSKSHLHDLSKFIPCEVINKMIDLLSVYLSSEMAPEFDFSALFADSTCIELDIHHPIDWVLLKDAVISIMKSVKTIRRHGLKHRIGPPESFITQANKISMAISMSKSVRRHESKKQRKNLFRELKSLLRVCEAHGYRYLKLLQRDWDKTDLSIKQAEQISRRIITVLNQVDMIVHQAHERIIGERQVHNKDKILSLHESHTQVYKRGKAGADVEFGLQLFIAENRDGLIVSWDLHDETPRHDSKFVRPCLEHLDKIDLKPDLFCGDRGFWSKKICTYLNNHEVTNHICPKGRASLLTGFEFENFKASANRRSQTEARIGILKNNFLGGHLKTKGFKQQKNQVGWAILTHNLWVVAKKFIVEEDPPLAIAA
jgi:hypothetical protein